MKSNECWLPDIIPCNSYGDYNSYLKVIYQIFKRDFIDSSPSYKNAIVEINRKIDKDMKMEEAFIHVTTQDYSYYDPSSCHRQPDLDRTARVPWIRPFITNNGKCSRPCKGIKIWKKRKGKRIRTLFLLEEERFLVVIENKKNWYVLVTSYYISEDHRLNKLNKEYAETTCSKN